MPSSESTERDSGWIIAPVWSRESDYDSGLMDKLCLRGKVYATEDAAIAARDVALANEKWATDYPRIAKEIREGVLSRLAVVPRTVEIDGSDELIGALARDLRGRRDKWWRSNVNSSLERLCAMGKQSEYIHCTVRSRRGALLAELILPTRGAWDAADRDRRESVRLIWEHTNLNERRSLRIGIAEQHGRFVGEIAQQAGILAGQSTLGRAIAALAENPVRYPS